MGYYLTTGPLGETFVTKKIVNGLCRIKYGKQKKLFLGNLYSKRDWGM